MHTAKASASSTPPTSPAASRFLVDRFGPPAERSRTETTSFDFSGIASTAKATRLFCIESDRAKFALQQILPSPDITIEHIFIDREISVDGLPGREMMALADDIATNTPILLYAAVLFDEDSYVTLHGWAGQFEDEDWGAEFKAITQSFKRK